MIKKVLGTLSFSIIDKLINVAGQLISFTIITRALGADIYALFGIVSSFFVFFNFFNIAIENSIFKEYKEYDGTEILSDFLYFSIFKILLLIVFYSSFYIFSKAKYGEDIKFVILSFIFLQIAEILTSVTSVYMATQLEQARLAFMSSVKFILILLSSPILFIHPSVEVLAIRDFFVLIIYITIFLITQPIFRKILLGLFTKRNFKKTVKMYWEKIRSIALWVHLNGVVTFFIYKSDVFILSIHEQSTEILGHYAMAVTFANFANIIPMIMNNHNIIVLSKCKTKEETKKVDRLFVILYFIVILTTIVGFTITGDYLIQLVSGIRAENVKTWTLIIIISLLIMKGLSGIYMSKIFLYGSLRNMFVFVSLPVFILTIFTYYFASLHYSATGLAYSNILVGLIWAFLVYITYRNEVNVTEN